MEGDRYGSLEGVRGEVKNVQDEEERKRLEQLVEWLRAEM